MSVLRTSLVALVAGLVGGLMARALPIGNLKEVEGEMSAHCSDSLQGLICEGGVPRGLELLAKEGRNSASLWAGDNGGALGIFQNSNGVIDLGVDVTGPSDASPKGTYLTLFQPQAAPQLGAGEETKNHPGLAKVDIWVSAEGEASIEIYDKEGRAVWCAPGKCKGPR